MKISRVTCKFPAGVTFGLASKSVLDDLFTPDGFRDFFSVKKTTVTGPSTMATLEVPQGMEKEVADLLRKLANELEA